MDTTQEFFGDVWHRFDRYDYDNGHIFPAAGAKLEAYRPWDAFGPPKGKDSRLNPYHSLLDLIRDIEWYNVIPPYKLPSGLIDKLLEWCSEHGLLGVLLHQLESMVLPDPSGNMHEGVRYVKTGASWQKRRRVQLIGETVYGAIVRRGLTDPELSLVSHQDPLITQFFPRLPPEDWKDLPLPFAADFWKVYSEPLVTFLSAAIEFRDGVQGSQLSRPIERMSEDDKMSWNRSMAKLRVLTSTVNTLLYPEHSTLRLGYVSGSLLGAFSMMATLDLSQRRVLRCPACRNSFTTKSQAALYCKKSCRKTMQMRRHRDPNRKGPA